MNKEKMVRSENKGRKQASKQAIEFYKCTFIFMNRNKGGGERKTLGCVCCKMDVKREREWMHP